ncbi:MAG TPA: family 1 encapsulin nanocompartment shell protein [Candidatus Binatia bacterium]|nr:family 1 encapsulin nanocompartment shell protein [Candidatus Binatia bacterium]
MSHDKAADVITDKLMDQIEAAAVSAAQAVLSGRRIIDVEGPYGIGLTTVEVGNDDRCREPGPDEASAVVSHALSVPMIYRRFAISKRRIAAFREMGQPLNLKAAEDAAQAVAAREEEFIYHGQPDFNLSGLLNAAGRQTIKGGNWDNVDEVLDDVITAVNMLDSRGYRGPYGLSLAPGLYNNLFRRYPGSDLLQIEHLKRLCTRGIVKADIEGGVLIARDVGSIVLGQDLQVSYLASDAAHEHFAISESLILKIEAPDAICTIPGQSATAIRT